MLDPFDRIRIVNLPQRRDRRREMDQELRQAGLFGDPRLSYFQAIRPDDRGDFTSIGARGIYESQKAILREAAAQGQSVLILEDDCAFSEKLGEFRPDPDADIVYGGYDASDPGDLHNSDIIGAHMMGFSARGAKLVSAYLESLTYEGIHPPIDAAYVWFRRAHPEVATQFAVPSLAHQRASRSDIAPLPFYDRVPGLREVAGVARRILRG